jgi:LysM repeat protein/peptidoglycan/xylan/chitin deacetylase (PgdA/CDA1 family)
VLITHDDAVSPLGNKGVRSVTDGFKNPNGCNIPATWFVTQDGSECPLVKALHDQNHEIAIHTVHHAQLSVGFKGLEQEMMGVRDWLHSDCGIPLEDMRGFRSPYLVNNEPVRQVLAKNGFLYDSSINEFVGEDSPATKTFGQRLWPYTMDNGIGQLCNWTYPDGQCFSTERYPGMWEVPMWDLPFTNDPAKTEESAYTMDYGAGFGGDVFTTLSTNFDAAYNGNRAPFPLFVHAPWFGKPASNTANAIKFMQYALSKPNVYFVTIQQLLAWMANPVPASQLATTLTCKPVDLTVPVTPSCQVYTVKAGDFLEKIAGQFGIAEVTDLVAVNPGLSASNIVPNQKIKIPPFPASCGAGSAEGTVPAAVPAAAVAVAAAPAPAAVEPVVQCPTWTVESGQYLDGIAAAAKASAADIMKLNGMSAATAGELSIGQVLKMPPYADCCATNSCEQPAPVAASDALPAAEPAAAAAPLSQSVVMGFYFAGMSPAMFEAEGQAPFVNAVSQLLGAPASAITAAVVPVRRRRALHSAADLVAVDVTVATADALATYKQADSTLK